MFSVAVFSMSMRYSMIYFFELFGYFEHDLCGTQTFLLLPRCETPRDTSSISIKESIALNIAPFQYLPAAKLCPAYRSSSGGRQVNFRLVNFDNAPECFINIKYGNKFFFQPKSPHPSMILL